VLFVILGALACFAPVQSDTWWLLRAGKDIWVSDGVSLVDHYSWTAAGLYWPNHEWLTEAIFFALFKTGGLPLLTGACAAVILLAWATCWRLTRGSFELRFLVFGACGMTSAVAWAIRPHVLTMAVFMGVVTLLMRGKWRWLPVVFVLWANLHGAVILGLVAVAATGAGLTLFDRRIPWTLVAVFIACAAATIVSPMGTGLWPFVLHSVERSRINQLIEWQPPGLSGWLVPFWLLAAAVPIGVIVRWRRMDREAAVLAAISLGILPLATQSVRNVPIFLLIAIPAITRLVAGSVVAPIPSSRGERMTLNAYVLGGAALIAAAVVVLGWSAPAPSLGWRPIAPQAVDAVKNCGSPIYNTYGDGGVLIWFVPEARVFIDNRQDPYPLDLLKLNHDAELSGDLSAIDSKYLPGCAAVPASSLVAQWFSAHAPWREQYRDAQWAVFTHGTSRPSRE
jgi:hypothetical protein